MTCGAERHAPYPIEQLARSAHTQFQIGFAKMTMRLMPAFDDVALEPTAEGLGANEMALTAPARAVRNIHADEVTLEEPRVRLRYEGELREPVMRVQVTVDPKHVEAVIQDLIAREATIDFVDWLHAPAVVRGEAPLRTLLGYPRVLETLAKGTAALEMRLSRYAPLPPGPGPKAA